MFTWKYFFNVAEMIMKKKKMPRTGKASPKVKHKCFLVKHVTSHDKKPLLLGKYSIYI